MTDGANPFGVKLKKTAKPPSFNKGAKPPSFNKGAKQPSWKKQPSKESLSGKVQKKELSSKKLSATASASTATSSAASEVDELRSLFGRKTAAAASLSPELLQPGRRVRFHAFGAIQAQDELRRQCRLLRDQLGEGQAAGALMVPCAARGMQLFGDCGVEESIVREVLQQPDLPLAGFFAGGELGPCGLRTYTHTFTTAMAVLRAR